MDLRILATDISLRALGWCRHGVYPARKLEAVSRYLRARYFTKHAGGDVQYELRDSPRRLVTFHRFNLAVTPYPMGGPFDAIFCRNVIIYFDGETRQHLLEEIHRLLRPGGYLLVGHAESLAGLKSLFRNVEPSIYVKADGPGEGGA